MSPRILPALQGRDRLAVGLGVITILVILFLSRGLPKVSQWRQEAVATGLELSQSVRGAEATVRNQAAAQDSLRVRTAYLAQLGSVYVTGSSSATLVAAMERAVDRAAVRASLMLGPSKITVDSLAAESVGISMRVQATGDLRHLVGFLAELEGGRPLLVVRELSLTRQSVPGDPESILADVLIQGVAHITEDGTVGARP